MGYNLGGLMAVGKRCPNCKKGRLILNQYEFGQASYVCPICKYAESYKPPEEEE